MNLPGFAVRRPIATSTLLIAAVLLGAVAIARLEVTLLPELRADELSIWLPYPDAAAEEVEESVARPVEETLAGVRGVRSLRTRIVPGGATVVCKLHEGVDADVVALGVRERLDTIRWALPDAMERPVILGTDDLDRPAMVLALAADDLPRAADWAESVLKPRLEQLEGVARVVVTGAPDREIRVVPDLARLEATGVSVGEIARALRDANVEMPGGYLRRREIRFAIEVESRFQRAKEIEDVVVARRGGRIVRVRDVARVVDGHEDARGFTRHDGRPAVGILLTREADANLVATAERVRERLDTVRAEFPSLAVAVVQDPSPFVRESIRGVWRAVWLGGLLAFGILFAFLRDVRSPIVLIVVLPVSVITTFSLLDLLGVSLNLMSLGGIALGIGMLVDNAIICLENIQRHRSEGLDPPRAAVIGAREVALPILASTLTTSAVFVPLAFVPGPIGELFADQAIAVTASLGVSLVLALTMLPILAGRIAPIRPARERLPFYSAYLRLLTTALAHPRATLALATSAFVLASGLLATRPRELFPAVATETLEVKLELPPGTDVVATDRQSREIEDWLLARPEVSSVLATIGAAGSLDPSIRGREENHARLRARVRDESIASRATLEQALRRRFANRPGFSLEIIADRAELAALHPRGEATLACRIAGPDSRIAEELATEIVARAGGAHATDPPLRLAAREIEPAFRLRPRDDVLFRYGLTESEALEGIRALTSGVEATRFRRFDEEDPVVIRAEAMDDPAGARVVAGGRTFPVSALFEVRAGTTPARLLREDQARVATILWDGPLRAVEPVRARLRAAAEAVGLPPGYTMRIGGAYEEMRRTMAAVSRAFALSAGLVLLILAAQYESLRLPFVIFAAVPLSTIGVGLTLFLTGGSVNVMTAIGAVILVGIVVNDAILKVDLLRRLTDGGMAVQEAIHVASRRRYRPILMTTATTSLALVPLFFGRGAELRAPLAAAVIGGLVSATVLTLVLIPVLFRAISGDARGPRAVR